MVNVKYGTKKNFNKEHIETMEVSMCYPDPNVESIYLIDTFYKEMNEKLYFEAWLYEEESMYKLMVYHIHIEKNEVFDGSYENYRKKIIHGILEYIDIYKKGKETISKR